MYHISRLSPCFSVTSTSFGAAVGLTAAGGHGHGAGPRGARRELRVAAVGDQSGADAEQRELPASPQRSREGTAGGAPGGGTPEVGGQWDTKGYRD